MFVKNKLNKILVGLSLLAMLGTLYAQVGASLSIERGDKRIRVVQNAPSNEGGGFIPSNKNCEEGVRLGTVYAPDDYRVETYVNDTLIRSNVALLRNPEGEGEDEQLELFMGSLEMNEPPFCPQNIERVSEPQVVLEEGRSTIRGTTFSYDNATGLGAMTGPINLQRVANDSSPALEADANSLRFDTDNDITILEDEVVFRSEGRTSYADSVEFYEERGLAILKGSPARSEEGGNIVEGNIIEYDLDNNDVVIKEALKATLEYAR